MERDGSSCEDGTNGMKVYKVVTYLTTKVILSARRLVIMMLLELSFYCAGLNLPSFPAMMVSLLIHESKH